MPTAPFGPTTSSSSSCRGWPTTTPRWWTTPCARSAPPTRTCGKRTSGWQARLRSRTYPGGERPLPTVLGPPEEVAVERRIGDLIARPCCGPTAVARPAVRGAVRARRPGGMERVAGRAPGARPPPPWPSVADLTPWSCTVADVGRRVPAGRRPFPGRPKPRPARLTPPGTGGGTPGRGSSPISHGGCCGT